MIKFFNAGFFPKSRGSSDKMFDLGGKTNRKNAPRMEIPIGKFDWRHVSNVLHVLMGERPVPTIRKTLLKPDMSIQEASRAAFVVIDTPCDALSPNEMITARKAVKDAWATAKIAYFLGSKPVLVKGGLLYWARLGRLLGDELLNDFINAIQSIMNERNVTRNITVHRAIEIMHDNYDSPRVRIFCQKCIKAKRTSLVNLINPDGNKDSITFHQNVGSKLNIIMVNSYPEYIKKISGTIIIPLDEILIARLSNGCGVATILEGGFAYIEGIEPWSDNLVFGAAPVIEAPIQNGGTA